VNKLTKKQENIPIYNSQKIKYLRISLTKEIKYSYNGNYKTLKKEVEGDTRRWKDLPCSPISRIDIGKTAMLLKTIYSFNVISFKFHCNSSQK
jgi:hypothetical protein